MILREPHYQKLFKDFQHLSAQDTASVLSTAVSQLKYAFNFFWVGFYLVENGENERLFLGPFSGPPACTTIKRGDGVCGTAWAESRSILVPDVNLFPAHIACSTDSKSEIVLPFYIDNSIYGVLDIDSDKLDDFDELDRHYLTSLLFVTSNNYKLSLET